MGWEGGREGDRGRGEGGEMREGQERERRGVGGRKGGKKRGGGRGEGERERERGRT